MNNLYTLKNVVPLNEISSKDCKALNFAIYQAEKSLFVSSLRLGACITIKGQHILRRKPT
jgi:hypothetical protein